MNELKEIKRVDKELLDKIEHILASELNCEEYDVFYNYFNEIRKPNILIDIKDDENIKEIITNLQSKIDKAIEWLDYENMEKYFECSKTEMKELLDILKKDK